MYADDYSGFLPPSRFSTPSQNAVHQTTLVRALLPAYSTGQSVWDGVGLLYQTDYIVAPGVFYCPSHHGDHPFANYVSRWPSVGTEIISNYQFRVGISNLLQSIRGESALVADSLRTQSDFNHTVGCNFLRADLSATWYTDSMGSIVSRLPVSESDAQAAARVSAAWRLLDSIDGNGEPR